MQAMIVMKTIYPPNHPRKRRKNKENRMGKLEKVQIPRKNQPNPKRERRLQSERDRVEINLCRIVILLLEQPVMTPRNHHLPRLPHRIVPILQLLNPTDLHRYLFETSYQGDHLSRAEFTLRKKQIILSPINQYFNQQGTPQIIKVFRAKYQGSLSLNPIEAPLEIQEY